MADPMDEIGGSPNTAGKLVPTARQAPTGAASGGGATTAYESEAQEQNIKDKAAGGHIIGMDDLGYMGHFASDKVTRQGHNVGHKPKGVAFPAARGGAKRGYHVLPGSASSVQGRNRYGAVTDHEMGLRSKKQRAAEAAAQKSMARAMKASAPTHPMLFTSSDEGQQPKGVVPRANGVSDIKMSIRHHLESEANDMKHAKEHLASAKKHQAERKAQQRRLPRRGK